VVPHVRQAFNWDCGLACCLMVLRALGVADVSLASLRERCPTKSIWTIDLAHLLAGFGAEVHFSTVTLGANPGFAGESFYAGSMAEDGRRVERLFREAGAAGICVQCRSIPAAELARLVASGHFLVVALVDKRRLSRGDSPGQLRRTRASGVLPRCCQALRVVGDAYRGGSGGGGEERGLDPAGAPGAGTSALAQARGAGDPARGGGGDEPAGDSAARGGGGTYTGHYVLLLSYEEDAQRGAAAARSPGGREGTATGGTYMLRDPATSGGSVRVSAGALEDARRAFGTDEDILLVARRALC